MRRSLYCLVLALFIGCLFSNLDARIYFMHVPKTGGTTLRLLLELQLSADEIYPFRNSKSAKAPVKENLVSGHFPYWFCKNLDDSFGEAFKVTILRDPVERYLSFLRAKQKADQELPDLESVLRLRNAPQKKYQEGLIDNALCRYLSTKPFLEGEALLENAKQTLSRFDCIVFFDNFNQDVADLFDRLGIDLDERDIPKINSTEKKPVHPKLLEEVTKLNELDIQLYAYAKEHFIQKDTRYALRTTSFESISHKTDTVDYTFDLPLCGRGWTYREMGQQVEYPIYRWVMDKPAQIYFSLSENSDYHLSFNAQPLTCEVLPRVSVNGVEIELVKLNDELFALYQGTIPKECITHDPTEISFYSLNSFQYRDIYPSHYNRNHPALSFALNRIRICPCEICR